MSRHYEENSSSEYYRKEHPHLSASASAIDWALDDEASEGLPAMRQRHHAERSHYVLIIDAKYYASTIQAATTRGACIRRPVPDLRVRENKQVDLERAEAFVGVSGVLTRRHRRGRPDATYRMSGSAASARRSTRTTPFEEIRAQLDGIASGSG